MAYTVTNFKSKKALKEAVNAVDQYGAQLISVAVYQPGPFGPDVKDGPCSLEGPHYPEPHRWYASCIVENGRIKPGSVR